MPSFRYPAFPPARPSGLAAFLEARAVKHDARDPVRELGEELSAFLRCRGITLVDSAANAKLLAALAYAERCGLHAVPPPVKKRAIASGFTPATTIGALRLAGFDVSLVDVDPATLGISDVALARALADDVALVCVDHTLGFPTRVDLIADLAAQHRVGYVLQDASETLALRVAGHPIHAWAAITTYNFDYESPFSTFGGGALVTNDVELGRAVEAMGRGGRACTHGYDEDLCEVPPGPMHEELRTRDGIEASLGELQALAGLHALESLHATERKRSVHYGILYETLSQHQKVTVMSDPFAGAAPSMFPVRVRNGDARRLLDSLRARGVDARTIRAGVLTDHPAFAALRNDGLENCRLIVATTICIGVHASLPTEDVEAVAEIVAEEADRL